MWLLPHPRLASSPTDLTRFDAAAFIATLCHYAMWSMLFNLAYYYYIIVSNFILIRQAESDIKKDVLYGAI